jgi:hypothetical protein
VFFMLFFALGVNQHTIDEHYDELVYYLPFIYCACVFFMLFFALGVNQHTIDEHYDELVYIFHKV